MGQFPKRFLIASALLVCAVIYNEERTIRQLRTSRDVKQEAGLDSTPHLSGQLPIAPVATAVTGSVLPSPAPNPDFDSGLLIAAQDYVSIAKRLKQRFDERPELKIPELDLLTPKEWLSVAARSDDLDTGEGAFLNAFGDLREEARDAFAQKIKSALHQYSSATAGSSPRDIMDLAPYLQPPANLAMLQRYALHPAGQDGEGSELAVVEKSSPDLYRDGLLSIGEFGGATVLRDENLQSPNDAPPVDDRDPEMHSLRLMLGMDEALSRSSPSLFMNGNLGRGLKKFAAENGGAAATDLWSLRSYLKDFDPSKAADALRPAFAAWTYEEANGHPPAAPEALAPFEAKLADPSSLLQNVKVSFGEGFRSIKLEYGDVITVTMDTE